MDDDVVTYTTAPGRYDWPTTRVLDPHCGILRASGRPVRRVSTLFPTTTAQRRRYVEAGETWWSEETFAVAVARGVIEPAAS